MRHEDSSPEIGHVLFLDIVGYSKLSTAAQAKLLTDLGEIVRSSASYSAALQAGTVLPIPTGDGMALVFFQDVTLPAECAREIWTELIAAGMEIRMGIHSGLVQRQRDIAGNENVAGEGINTAQRVMDFGDGGHILLSSQYGVWLRQFEQWAPNVHDLGTGTAKHGQRISLHNFFGERFGRADRPPRLLESEHDTNRLRVVLLYKRNAQPDERLLNTLEQRLTLMGHSVFIDRHLRVGVEWAKAIEYQIRQSDAVIAMVSDASTGSEMLEYEIETAFDEYQKRGKPMILPIRVGSEKPIEGPIGAILNPLNFAVWCSDEDTPRVLAEIESSIVEPQKPKPVVEFEPAGGAVPPDSKFYVERAADAEFLQALRSNESIVLIKGPRQMGKTSLLGRGAVAVRNAKWRTAMTDFQKLSATQLASEETFYRLLAATLARQLKFSYDFNGEWLDVFGPNMNMDNFVRELLESSDTPLVWFMDEADKLFGSPFASDFFGLVRSWHNSRATEPFGSWARFTVVISYATEAHLFIQDLNQSPFNVGRRIELQCFGIEHLQDLNVRYGSPLSSFSQVQRLHRLVGGQPFLTRRAFDVLSLGQMDFENLITQADRDDGPFGDHLKRILISVSQMPSVLEAMRSSLSNPVVRDADAYHRLLAAGIVQQSSDGRLEFRSELQQRYLSSHLAP